MDRRGPLGLTRYQWLVLFAAWLGWGFDAFDALLFNLVAPVCVPNLLHLAPASPEGRAAAAFWNGALTSELLVGWAVGGIVFGRLTDRLGRTRTLLLTMVTYALGTAACAFAPNLGWLAVFRGVASLGIGGEWAAGASLVAETVPEDLRVVAGALLYTSAPLGLALANAVTSGFEARFPGSELAWRASFLTGLVPAFVGLILRARVREPARWAASGPPARLGQLFAPSQARRTMGGLLAAVVALVTWWSCNAFLPLVARTLAPSRAEAAATARHALVLFNLGGIAGTLLTIPLARLGRRPMLLAYFAGSAAALWFTFGADVAPPTRVLLVGTVGLAVFGVLAAFTFYLPELFPTRLRGTGAGFTYNTGRLLTAVGPFLVGRFAQSGESPLLALRWVAAVPLVGVVAVVSGLVVETRGRPLE